MNAEEKQAVQRLVKAARAATCSIAQPDDPANLPEPVHHELWEGILGVERLLNDGSHDERLAEFCDCGRPLLNDRERQTWLCAVCREEDEEEGRF